MTDIMPASPGDTNPTAADRLRRMIRTDHGNMSVWTADEIRVAIDAVRAEVERELLGDEQNPSPMVLNAVSYRLLVDRIEATMTDPDQWDGDDAEVEILARYVEWLAAGSPVEDGWPVRPEAGAR